jgi:regulator of RNase E activity RraA
MQSIGDQRRSSLSQRLWEDSRMTTHAQMDDRDLFSFVKTELFTAVVGDVMDVMGLTNQFLPPKIRPLRDDMVIVGRAMPVLEADYAATPEGMGKGPLAGKPFGMMMEALDDLREGDVYVATGSTGEYALWGELMTSRARQLKAVGAVLDGYTRDTRGILAQGFPVFGHGPYAQDQGIRGKVVDWRTPVYLGAARVEPGDLIFGDVDGVLVVPSQAVNEVLAHALEKVRGERAVELAIQDGMGAAEAYRTFGIL